MYQSTSTINLPIYLKQICFFFFLEERRFIYIRKFCRNKRAGLPASSQCQLACKNLPDCDNVSSVAVLEILCWIYQHRQWERSLKMKQSLKCSSSAPVFQLYISKFMLAPPALQIHVFFQQGLISSVNTNSYSLSREHKKNGTISQLGGSICSWQVILPKRRNTIRVAQSRVLWGVQVVPNLRLQLSPTFFVTKRDSC